MLGGGGEETVEGGSVLCKEDLAFFERGIAGMSCDAF